MKRFLVLSLAAAMLFAASAALAQTKVISITQIVEHPALDNARKGFMDGLKEAGVDAKFNVHIAQGNSATNVQIAGQMLDEKPNLVLAIATPGAQVCAQKIKDIPVLFTAVSDPVGAGLVKSMQAPGGNLTGMTDMPPVDKQIELIKTILPKTATVGIVYNAGEANSVSQVNAVKAAAAPLNIKIVEATVANSGGVYQAAKSLVGKCDAVYIPLDNTVVSAFESLVKVCDENKLPLFSSDNESVGKGAIAALAVDYYAMGKQTAAMGKKILDGAKPADLPVESLKNLDIHLNLKAAKAQGVTIPEAVVAKAVKKFE
ncbi:ABC transporter substrate-binding protein [Fundidesulfovibrio soli]|uniref:ABC transporter substrate-binding protein n=1 Tax=Fundidesulfovibrio soli TaxID=2922716 RepID=UPI001FAED123|nr:ABC transporter substrate-binding protein [Fundidesulfovibrio soli]